MEEFQTILCRNGTFSKNYEIDDNCALATIERSIIVTRRDNELLKDIKLALENFDSLFSNEDAKFKIFNEFGKVSNLLFNVNKIMLLIFFLNIVCFLFWF